jgi:glucokinase
MTNQVLGDTATAPYVVGMDLGGTKILAAIVDAEGRLLAEAKRATKASEGPDAVIRRMAQAARRAARQAGIDWSEIAGAGVGAPGPIDPESGMVYNPPNLPGWDEVALGPRLSEALGVPVYLENDVNLGTLGEYALGAGRDTKDMVGIFVGTGIGGGVILDGELRSGFRHAAGEVGHMIIFADGPVCGCGRRGCLESVASRTAIERDIRLGIAAGRKSIVAKLVRDKGRLTSGVIARALRKGDSLTTEVVGRAQWYLGLMTASIVNRSCSAVVWPRPSARNSWLRSASPPASTTSSKPAPSGCASWLPSWAITRAFWVPQCSLSNEHSLFLTCLASSCQLGRCGV